MGLGFFSSYSLSFSFPQLLPDVAATTVNSQHTVFLSSSSLSFFSAAMRTKLLSGQAAELSLKGSPYWMAPEVMQAVMQKDSEYGLAVDIWSLGCTVIEMFTGKAPWMELEWAAAMFKVLRNETPPIPEALSAEGKDFVRLCLQRDPAHRPSASALLEHPFVNNSNHQELPSCVQGFLQTKPMDVQSPRCMASLMQMCPGTRGNKSKEQLNGDTSQSYSESSKRSAGASRHSPRSTLDALSGLSPPRSNDKIWHSSAPESLPNKKQFGTRNGHPIPLPSSVREAASLSRHNLIEVPSEKFKLMASSNPRGAQSLAYRTSFSSEVLHIKSHVHRLRMVCCQKPCKDKPKKYMENLAAYFDLLGMTSNLSGSLIKQVLSLKKLQVEIRLWYLDSRDWIKAIRCMFST
ncbi:hypothetical protein ACLOJK_003058 [Asimina triloba]